MREDTRDMTHTTQQPDPRTAANGGRPTARTQPLDATPSSGLTEAEASGVVTPARAT